MTVLRDAVARSLELLLAEHGLDDPWSDRAESTTRTRYSTGELYAAGRMRLHDRMIGLVRSSQNLARVQARRTVVVTSGPPGAGKSTAIDSAPDFAGFLSVDSDDFKDALLQQAAADGLLERFREDVLPDEKPVAVRELAGFVHAESTAIAEQMRLDAFAEGVGVVVHGTLSSLQHSHTLLAQLDAESYRRIIILDVRVGLSNATNRCLNRWWNVRSSDRDALGGRFVPAAALQRYYPSTSQRSVCADNAEAFAELARGYGWDVDLRVR